MAQFVFDILGVIIRWAITAIAGYLVGNHILNPTDGDYYMMEALKHTSQIVILIMALAWGIMAKYKSRIMFLTALVASEHSNEEEVRKTIADGKGATLQDT